MASRDIANMHLFLDLKKKFPDLPDETLRNFIFLYAEDKEKCTSLLQKEIENHYHSSQPFADFHPPDNVSSRKSEHTQISSRPQSEDLMHFPTASVPSSSHGMQMPSGRSTSHAGVIHLPQKSWNSNMFSKPDSYSAPVVSNEKPFTDMYKHIPISSHGNKSQDSDQHKMMFSTTKEYIVSGPSQESNAYLPISSEAEQSRQHAVKLSITPAFPFPQQALNFFNNSSYTTTHSSRPGHHTTSINFQLQPESSNQYPLEISTIPTSVGSSNNNRDFGSHVQISIGSQGATFTALRVQRPGFSPNQNTPYIISSEEPSFDFIGSSQTQKNSSLQVSPSQQSKLVPELSASENYNIQKQKMLFHPTFRPTPVINFQTSPEYVLDVRNLQIAKLDAILNELEKEKKVFSELKAEVNKMEVELAQTKASKNAAAFLQVEKINKLREENRQLRIECNCLLMEVDMCNVGQVPLGVTDENFYSNIYTGPNCAISSSKKENSSFPKQKGRSFKKKKSFDDDEDERNRWKCKKCTFANHPALEKCEMCELPKSSGSFFDN